MICMLTSHPVQEWYSVSHGLSNRLSVSCSWLYPSGFTSKLLEFISALEIEFCCQGMNNWFGVYTSEITCCSVGEKSDNICEIRSTGSHVSYASIESKLPDSIWLPHHLWLSCFPQLVSLWKENHGLGIYKYAYQVALSVHSMYIHNFQDTFIC